MAARAMMEKIFIGLSFPKSEERNMGPHRTVAIVPESEVGGD